MTIKLSGVPEQTGSEGGKQPLPEGWYTFRVDSAEYGKSPNKGTPQITVWTKVDSGDYAEKTRLMNFYLSESALWKLQLFLLSFGYEKARNDIEPEDLVADLERLKPKFRSYAKPNGEYNEFTQFDAVIKEGSDLPFSSDDELDELLS